MTSLVFFRLLTAVVSATTLYNIAPRLQDEYNIENLVSEFGLQYCAIVEIGQGYCSLFAEFREAPNSQLKPGTVAEVFLGECECSKMREWQLCGPELTDARGEICKFKEATGRDPTSARVHRRLCDFDHILSSRNKPCDCLRRFDERPLHPVKGFLTCFRTPVPRSICQRHSVCGVHRCKAQTVEGLAMVRCDTRCKGMQPFCEEPSKPPLVTSYWSDWSVEHKISFSAAKVSESICLSRDTRAPAYDCLGPGAYCCPQEVDNCFCDVETTIGGRKVRRFSNIDSHSHYPRSINVTKIRKRRHWLWDKLFSTSRHNTTAAETQAVHEKVPAENDETVFMIDYKSGKKLDFSDPNSRTDDLDPTRDFIFPVYLAGEEEPAESAICIEQRNITDPICPLSKDILA